MNLDPYQTQMVAYAEVGVWAVIGLAAFVVFALGVLLVKAVW